MDHIQQVIGDKIAEKETIRRVLDESLSDRDFYGRTGRDRLIRSGLDSREALQLLCHYKSKVKYGYALSHDGLSHLLDLAAAQAGPSFLKNLFESPFFVVKACWIYDHAPYFLFYDEERSGDRDALILEFAQQYDQLFLKNRVSTEHWEKMAAPRRLFSVSFWEKKIIDPVALMEKAFHQNIEGLELSIDFHPFNYSKLLPEEFSEEKRVQIKEARGKSGLRIDIHSPIVGPYSPYPEPKRGKQLFYDPLQCEALMGETIELAKDLGAEVVTVHLIDTSNPKKMARLIMEAAGSPVRVALENYCQTDSLQNASTFIEVVDEIAGALPKEVKEANFGVTLDVGHFNIEGEDPLVASDKIGKWCRDKKVFLRVHATDNYGKLLFNPPDHSADVHGRMAGRGIDNATIIKLLRSMGHTFDVVAEQIQPLSEEDIAVIHEAQTIPLEGDYRATVQKGKALITKGDLEKVISRDVLREKAYLFMAGLMGASSLMEHLVFRKIQDQKYLSVDEARQISQDFMKMPQTFRKDLLQYVDELLLPVQGEQGILQKSDLDLICQNISGALFGTIHDKHMNAIFSKNRRYRKGDVICRQGSQGREMYLIKKGSVEVLINDTPMASLGQGEIFGEISLFYNVERSATVKATSEETKLGILNRPALESLLEGRPAHTMDLVFRLYKILPERLRNLNEKYRTAVKALGFIIDEERGPIPREKESPPELRMTPELFPALTREEAEQVFGDRKDFDADQMIFVEGERGDSACYILEGKVKVATFSNDDDEIILGELGKGDVVGEMALIDDRPRSASIIAMTPCKVVCIKKRAFNRFLETRSDLAYRLMAFICLSLFRRILALDRDYEELKRQLVQ